ncbi:hypothetical protein MMC08_002753 [Hypocenomyce scalaris]|nr:hypothetical protein [Hypocenomyce scalaris]
MAQQTNKVFNHVGVSVPNLDEAAEWYIKMFGYRRIHSNTVSDRKDDPESAVFKIYGETLRRVKVAYLSTGNGVGFEIFEISIHIAITAADPDAMAQKVTENGGKRIVETFTLYGERALYIQDPLGNTVEFMSSNFD